MIETGIIVLCLLINALLAGGEMAFVAVNNPSLRELVRQGHKKAELLLRLREHPERTLSVIQIGITMVAALAGAVGGAGAEEELSPTIETWFGVTENTADTIAIGIVVLPLTYFTVVIGELVPKTLALKHTLGFALRAAPWLALSDKILGPLVTILEWSTKRLVALLNLWPTRRGEGELKEETVDTVELGSLSTQHRQYVLNLVDLETKRVQDIYLTWEQVITVDVGQSAQEVETVVITSGHTRLPGEDAAARRPQAPPGSSQPPGNCVCGTDSLRDRHPGRYFGRGRSGTSTMRMMREHCRTFSVLPRKPGDVGPSHRSILPDVTQGPTSWFSVSSTPFRCSLTAWGVARMLTL